MSTCVCVCFCVCLCMQGRCHRPIREQRRDTSRSLIPCLNTSHPSPLSTTKRQSHTPPSAKAPKVPCRIHFERYATHYVRLRAPPPPHLLPLPPQCPLVPASNAPLLWTSGVLGSQPPAQCAEEHSTVRYEPEPELFNIRRLHPSVTCSHMMRSRCRERRLR